MKENISKDQCTRCFNSNRKTIDFFIIICNTFESKESWILWLSTNSVQR